MIKIESEYHITTTFTYSELPKYKCMGDCKKVWWKEDIEKDNDNVVLMSFKCPSCNGSVRHAKDTDYKILEQNDLRMSEDNVQISHVSKVKPEFIELAKKTWCKD